MAKKLLFFAILSILFVSHSVSFASDDLSRYTMGEKAVKAYLGNFVNESGQTQINAEDFKKVFKNALLNRKSIKFELAGSPETSNIQISAVIKKYLYSKTDPITFSPSPAGLLLDAVTTENYAEMTAEFTVTDTKSGKVMWQNTLMTYIKHTMTPEESIPLIEEKLSRTFLWKSFGKPNA